MQRGWRIALLLGVAAGSGLLSLPPARAVEPVREMVDALCNRQWFDTAVDYLASLKSNASAPDDIKRSVEYEQGLVYIRAAGTISDSTLKEKALDDGAKKLAEFIQANPQSELVPATNNQIATIFLMRGRARTDAALMKPEDKSKLTSDARSLLGEAQKRFDAAEKDLSAKLKTFPPFVPPEERELAAKKQQVAGELAQAQLRSAEVDYELARTADAGSADSKKYYKSAADKYNKAFQSYRTRYAGLFAHLWEGRCYQALGDSKQAIGCFRDLIDIPVDSREGGIPREILWLRNGALRQALELWTSPSEKKYQAAIDAGEKWLSAAAGTSEQDVDALAIRYLTAFAYQEQASALGEKDPGRRKLLVDARPHVVQAAKFPNEFQKPARVMLAALDKTKGKDGTEKGPANFAEAVERGKEALELQQAAVGEMKAAEEAKDDAAVADAKKRKEEQTANAMKYLRRALELADGSTNVEELNAVRYYITFLCWDTSQFYEAAVMGEFLAKRYPKSAQGRQGAIIAMWSFVKIYSESKQANKSWEVAQVLRTSEFIARNWPDEPDTEAAVKNLLDFAIQDRQADKAIAYLDKIPADSPARGEAELKTGQALWTAYARGMQAPIAERLPQTELDALKKKAQEVLENGIKRMQEAPVSRTIVGAAMSLAQIFVDTGQPEKAIELLENAKYGPLTLVRANSDITRIDPFPVETHKFALRAYVAMSDLKKAEDEMKALETLAASDAKSSQMLTAVYIALGRELQQQLKLSPPDKARAISKGFELFLTKIAARETGSNYNTMSWIAETFHNLATTLDDESKPATKDVVVYYEKSVEAYNKILAIAAKKPDFLPSPEAVLAIRLRIAACHRRTNRFDEAIKILTEVLREKPMMLAIQIQGAETYQGRGAIDKTGYAQAITGGQPGKDGQNIIWGWSKLAKMTMKNDKFVDAFHLARYNTALCKYEFGLAQTDEEKKKQFVDVAQTEIRITHKLYPDLGGKELTEKYDTLMRRTQTTLGQKAVGLAALGPVAAAGAAPANGAAPGPAPANAAPPAPANAVAPPGQVKNGNP